MQEILGEQFTKGMETYRKAVEGTQWLFVVVLGLTVLEIAGGLLAIRSRWYSWLTTMVSVVGSPFF
jgi:hypothetical protein